MHNTPLPGPELTALPPAHSPNTQVYDYMDANKVEPTEMTFTALARCAALRGDGAAAFAWVRAKGAPNRPHRTHTHHGESIRNGPQRSL